jgi:hypothetical protein
MDGITERALERLSIATSKEGKDAGWIWHYQFTISRHAGDMNGGA